jgi:hypothetical protein
MRNACARDVFVQPHPTPALLEPFHTVTAFDRTVTVRPTVCSNPSSSAHITQSLGPWVSDDARCRRSRAVTAISHPPGGGLTPHSTPLHPTLHPTAPHGFFCCTPRFFLLHPTVFSAAPHGFFCCTPLHPILRHASRASAVPAWHLQEEPSRSFIETMISINRSTRRTGILAAFAGQHNSEICHDPFAGQAGF